MSDSRRTTPTRVPHDVSILIVTRNRAVVLKRLLASLASSVRGIREIVVLDNASTDTTQSVLASYRATLPLRVCVSDVGGYPNIYNEGLRRCRGSWVVFLDDDCVVMDGWWKGVLRAIRAHPDDAIQGKVVSGPKGNVYAEIMGDHYANWVSSHLIGDGQMDTFDNKNLIIPRRALYPGGRFSGFDPAMYRGSEDIEFGLRLRKQGFRIIYDPSFTVVHEERTTLSGFVRQHLRMAGSERVVYRMTGYANAAVFPKRKTILNMRSFATRLADRLRHVDLLGAAYTVLLYGILFAVRLYGYATAR